MARLRMSTRLTIEDGEIILDQKNLERHVSALISQYNVLIHKIDLDEEKRQFYIGHVRGMQIVIKIIRDYQKIEEETDNEVISRTHERIVAMISGMEY